MNIEARRIAPPRRARFFQLAIAIAALSGTATASAAMLDSGGYIETFDGLSAALPPSATTDGLLATSSTSLTISGLALQLRFSGTSAALTGLAADAEPTEPATTNPTPTELSDAVDLVTTPSTFSLLYAPLAAGALYCCFGWTTTRFKRRPIRSSAQTTDSAASPDLDLIALRPARHNSSDSIAA